MIVQMSTWEARLLELAHEGLESSRSKESSHSKSEYSIKPAILQRAYRHCEEITQRHSRTFYLASKLLPVEKRLAVRALYAFCRISDDLVDRAPGNVENSLKAWKQTALHPTNVFDNMAIMAWTDTRKRFQIPIRYAEQLIEGVASDISITRYKTFEDLAFYSYRVASTVGLMSMHIIGFSSTDALQYAVKMGVALQLTNILRDVGEDWRSGRLYLPLGELDQYNLCEDDISNGHVDDRWRSFMRFQIDRNRRLYSEAMPGIRLLHPDGQFAIASAAMLYQSILEDIELHDYDVFNRRAFVSPFKKILQLPGIWLRL